MYHSIYAVMFLQPRVANGEILTNDKELAVKMMEALAEVTQEAMMVYDNNSAEAIAFSSKSK